MIDELVKLANHLDSNGLINEADYLDRMIKEARMLSREHSSWPAEMWPHQKDLFNGNGMLRAIAKAALAGEKVYNNDSGTRTIIDKRGQCLKMERVGFTRTLAQACRQLYKKGSATIDLGTKLPTGTEIRMIDQKTCFAIGGVALLPR